MKKKKLAKKFRQSHGAPPGEYVQRHWMNNKYNAILTS
jgi:hypothetical protein